MLISYDVHDWNKGWYQDKAPVRKCARPWKMVHETKSGKAVVCCHGYTGYPGELVRPGVDLYDAGFDVFAMRYNGHGTSGKDFLSSGREDWLGAARNCLQDVMKEYETVYLVGHSMGGIIAAILASEFPQVKRMALIAPAFDMKPLQDKKMMCKLRLCHLFVKRIKVDWKADPSYHLYDERDKDDDAYLGKEYWSFMYPGKLWDLYELSLRGKKALKTVQADTLSISGGEDMSVTEHSSEIVAEKPLGKNKHLHIPAGHHLLPYDKDIGAQNEAMEAVRDWLLL